MPFQADGQPHVEPTISRHEHNNLREHGAPSLFQESLPNLDISQGVTTRGQHSTMAAAPATTKDNDAYAQVQEVYSALSMVVKQLDQSPHLPFDLSLTHHADYKDTSVWDDTMDSQQGRLMVDGNDISIYDEQGRLVTSNMMSCTTLHHSSLSLSLHTNPHPELHEVQVVHANTLSTSGGLKPSVFNGSFPHPGPPPHMDDNKKDEAVKVGITGAEPRGYKRLVNDPILGPWYQHAGHLEIWSLYHNQTFEMVRVVDVLHKQQHMLKDDADYPSIGSTHFVPKVKTKDDGKGNATYNKVKLRLVFDGQFMEKDYDYSSSFSPVVKMDTFKLLMALKALNPKL